MQHRIIREYYRSIRNRNRPQLRINETHFLKNSTKALIISFLYQEQHKLLSTLLLLKKNENISLSIIQYNTVTNKQTQT